MLGLPRNTEFNRIIPKEKLLARAVTADSVRDVYESQISRIIWRNKLSRSTYLPYSAVSAGSELELIEIQTKMPALDKRILNCIDRSIPYYIFHVVTNNNLYQAWAAEKSCLNRTVRVESYHHTGWLQEQDFRFVFTGNTPKITLKNLIKQVDSFCIKPMNEQFEKCSEFMEYFRSMRMSRSYKPVLVLAAIQCGGTISLEKAAQQFIRFYQGRVDRGQPTEKGYCVYCDKEASLSKVYYNLVNMPIAALCSSGYFTYDSITRTFSFADNLYDSLSLEEIDEIESICKMRLSKYFNKISSK